MTILCEVDEPVASALTTALGGQVHPVTSLSAVSVALSADLGEHVVVLGVDISLADVLTFMQHIETDYPGGISVILLRSSLEGNTAERAHAAGVRAVLSASDIPAVVGTVQYAEAENRPRRTSLEKVAAPSTEQAPRPRGRLVTVFAAKGGSGKTTLSTNLATVLNDGGAHTVCLVDLDLEFGDVAVSMQLTPARTIVDAVGMRHVDAINISGLVTPYRPNFNCVLAPIEPGDAEKIPIELITELLEALLTTHEYVVVDTPSQLSEPVLAAMDMTHHFLLLTTPEIPALKNLRLTLDMLDLLGYDPNARVIVFNRADARAGLSAAEVETAIKTPIGARIPQSTDVPASINRGVPLAVSHPKHVVTLAIKQLAQTYVTGEATTTRRQSGRRGLKLRMRSS